MLFQIPQRYRFSSKSQHYDVKPLAVESCFRYHKGTDFQANHNIILIVYFLFMVVLDTTKVQIFKQITTALPALASLALLFQIPQRYRFSSKSQPLKNRLYSKKSCFRYHKGTDFQANHNGKTNYHLTTSVVLDTTKVQIFKQITTIGSHTDKVTQLFQIPQRYRFSSKSQQGGSTCLILHVVLDTTKVQIFKQITTADACFPISDRCFRYHKGTDFQANHNSR